MGKWFGVALLDNGKSGTPVNVDVSEKTKVSVQTLRNWHYERPEAFRAVCYAVAMGYQP